MFFPYPPKAVGMSHEQHREACHLTRCTRIHLKYLCDKTLQKHGLQCMDPQAEQTATANLILLIQSRNQKQLEEFLLAFIRRTVDPPVIQVMAKVLSLLVGDAAVSSVVPFRYVLETCAAIRNNANFDSRLEEMKEYGVKLSEVLLVSKLHNVSTKCVDFVEYLVDEVVKVHCNDRPMQPVAVIDKSYNPEKGTAYYFTPHGNQFRRQPKYSIDSTNKNYDDVPWVDEICKKKFPTVSYGVYGYIFLWFCPIHGHCYGFHLISGGEGRKDPFSSLFKYKPHAPPDIFYDFACQ